MRIVLPCATIAAITSAWGLLVSADGGAAAAKELDAVDGGGDDDEDIATSRSRAPRSMRDAAENGEECDHHLEGGGIGTKADVGVLRCGPGRTCAADVTSSVGGRCVTSSSSSSSSVIPIERPDAPLMAAFPSRGLHVMMQRGEHALRRLQNSTEDSGYVCPKSCPQNICDCLEQGDIDANFATCAPVIHSACITGLVSECVPDYYPTSYTDIYCHLVACLVDGPEGCTSEYDNYCQDYALEEDVHKCCCYVQEMFELSGNTTVSAVPNPDNSTEDAGYACPTNCPQNICDCLEQGDDFDVATCAPVIHSACITGLFSECVPDYLATYYTEIACNLVSCLDDGPEGCVNEYYKDYCRATYALEEDVDKCCCYTQKWFELFGNTTVSADPTPPPSDPLTVSLAPMITSAPTPPSTLTTVPSVAPTSSSRGAPTVEPSDSPIVMPAPIIIPAEDNANAPGSVAASPPTMASSVGRRAAHRPIAMAAFAASLFFSAGGAFWIFA